MITSRQILATVLGMFYAMNAAVAADPKIEEQELGPAGQWLGCVISPHGLHAAVLAMKGSRYVVLIDGVEGPKIEGMLTLDGSPANFSLQPMQFDNRNFPVLFSDDGTHCAYYAKAGSEYVLMLNGKELSRGKLQASTLSYLPLQFSAGGKHLFYMESDTTAGYRFVVDGKPELWLQDAPQLVLSPEGSHYAYVAKKRGEQTPLLFVDGKEAGYAGESPQFTTDGQHLFTMTRQGAVAGLLVDGKLKMKSEGFSRLSMAPVGGGFAVVVSRSNPRGEFLVVNGKKVEGSDCQTVEKVCFSPDAKRFAAICRTDGNAEFVIIDGKKGQEYPSIFGGTAGAVSLMQNLELIAWQNGRAPGDQAQFDIRTPTVPGFTPDGSKFIYVANVPPRYFLVVNDEESDGYTGLVDPVLGGGGKRIGFLMASLSSGKQTVVVDGKVTEQKNPQGFSFSPEGSHYAFLAGDIRSPSLYLDGVEQTGIATSKHYLFSPDGKHLALTGYSTTDPSQHGLFIDGKFAVADSVLGNRVERPVFTPDSQHLLWLGYRQVENPSDPDIALLFVDGKPSMHFAPFGAGVTGNWEMSTNGVLSFVARTGDAIKRFRVTPSPDTSIATMIAGSPAQDDTTSPLNKSKADAGSAAANGKTVAGPANAPPADSATKAKDTIDKTKSAADAFKRLIGK